ncbi:MAG: hypothetical protein CMM85_06070 [Rhodothermaceae bacterium]|nr:hypothetical protein [Rhodothermaceae bacterium]
MHQVNPVFRPAFATDARYRIIYGGAGSSKSVSTAQDFVRRAGSTGDVRVLVVRKVYRTCRNSTFKLFCDILRALGRYRMVAVNKQEMTITFPSGGEILHAGLDDVEKLKSFAGITHVWVEEATEMDFPASEDKEPDLAQLDLRVRGVATELVPSITLTFNPTLRALKLFEYLGVPTADLPVRAHKTYTVSDTGTAADRVYVQHTTYRDNPWIGPEYVAVFSKLGGVMQAVYERGELVAVDAPDQLIKYEWVKAAFERLPEDAWTDGRQRMACDVARFGDDETTTGVGEGYVLEYVEAAKGQDTTATGKRLVSLANERSVAAELVAVDVVGLGSGAADTARSEGLDVAEFVGGASPVPHVDEADGRPGLEDSLEFNNLRSQALWYLSVQLEAGTVAFSADLPADVKRKLQEDLLAPRYRIGQEKRIEVEPKDGKSKTWGIKQRLGRSPDYGDMEAMRLFAEHLGSSIDYSTVF